MSEIQATQITMGRGLVDVARIDHEGRSGILFRPRDRHIPVGEEGEIGPGKYWPVGDLYVSALRAAITAYEAAKTAGGRCAAERSTGGYFDAGAMLAVFLMPLAAIVSLAAWLIWALVK